MTLRFAAIKLRITTLHFAAVDDNKKPNKKQKDVGT
jgi:hypothetical protein